MFNSAYAPVSELLFFMLFVVGLLSLGTMVYLRWFSPQNYANLTLGAYSYVAILFFFFAAGGFYFNVLLYGAIWVVGVLLVGVAYGAVTGFVLFAQADSIRIRLPPDSDPDRDDSEAE
jgi:hypothetical protein